MDDGSQQPAQFKPQPPTGESKGPTTHATEFFVRSIYVYVHESPDKKRQAGTVTFVSDGGAKLFATLRRTVIPAGTWEGTLDADLKLAEMVCKFPEDIDPELVDALNQFADKALILTWSVTAKTTELVNSGLQDIDRALRASVGRTLRIVVSYTKAKSGNAKSIPDSVPLTEGDNTVLRDPVLAIMYLAFVEHFGKVNPDFTLAEGGLTEDEIAEVEQDRPEIIAITNLFVQCLAEFETAKFGAGPPPPDLENFRAMTEAIFYQKAAKNDLARRNMLAISLGTLIERTDSGFSSRVDIGVIERSRENSHTLLYDRDGIELRFGATPLDKENRAYDLEKLSRDSGIPHLSLEVEDKVLYAFLRNVEQQLSDPLRDVESIIVSRYKHIVFITNEMHRINAGRIAARVIDMLPAVLAFFVAHAVLAQLIKRGHPAAAGLSALLVGAGLILGVDFSLMQMGLFLEAGRHFHRMEELHREAGDTEPKLTALSATHLRQGADLLIQAIEEFIALGVIIVGTLGIGAAGRAVKRGLERQAQARSRLTVENDKAVKIESLNADKKPKIARGEVKERGLSKGKVNEKVPEKKPIESDGPLVGAAREGKVPKEKTDGAKATDVEWHDKLDVHLRERDLAVKQKDGIGGAHNKVAFEEAVRETGAKVTSRTSHPTMEGVERVEYQMPKRDRAGEPMPGEFKAEVFRKTTYDPAKISDAEFLRLGQEAAIEAKTAGRLNREWVGRASNGEEFRGYLDSAGKVKSFFPNLERALPDAPKLRIELPPEKFPAQTFFNAIPDVRFVDMLRLIISGVGWSEESSSCEFTNDGNVRFSVIDEDLTVGRSAFESLVREVADAQKLQIPAQAAKIDETLLAL